MKMNMPSAENVILKLAEKNLRDFLNEVKSKAAIDANTYGSQMHTAFMNQQLELFVIDLKETYENQKKIFEMSGNAFVTKLKFYSLINKVVDDIYPEFNPDWEHQKKYSKYRDPDDMLLMY